MVLKLRYENISIFGMFVILLKKKLIVLLNLIKRFDLETCQPGSLPSSSFKLNHVGANLK